ncbi:MAG: ABC transporter permease, partial [Alphaproteobacteria bacterium]
MAAETAVIGPRRRWGGSWTVRLAGGFLLVLALVALLAPWIAPHDPLAQDLLLQKRPPIWADRGIAGHLLGTDSLGRDVLSRLIFGARTALIVALAAATLACLFGTILGLVAGFYGGWTDTVVSRLVDVWMS